jgi:hypothetical protein
VNLATTPKKTLNDYGIKDSLGDITADGASNNNVMVEELSEKLARNGIHWNAETHRPCCNCHIINLVILAFLFGIGPANLDDRGLANDDVKAEALEWRKRGSLGKAPQHHQAYLRKCSAPGNLSPAS